MPGEVATRGGAPPLTVLLPEPLPPSRRRAIAILALGLALIGILLATMLWPAGAHQAAPPCAKATEVDSALAQQDAAGATRLFALVGPASALNTALGAEPGCQALYRSDDDGVSWTAVFSATAEAPVTLLPADGPTLYLLTQSLRFPLTLAGNVYRSQDLGAAWTWQRISPQDRHAVPNVAIADLLAGYRGELLLRAANGDGAALLRSSDRGATWKPLIIPGLLGVGSVAVADDLLAVAPQAYLPGASPGEVSRDGGRAWQPLAPLPRAATSTGLAAILGYLAPEQSLILELAPAKEPPGTAPIARYRSQDHGRSWQPVSCGALPAAGCAPIGRWSETASARYVLYHQRLYRQVIGATWQPLALALPVPAATVSQILALAGPAGDRLWLVTTEGLWQVQPDGRWRKLGPPLLPAPQPSAVPGASAPPA
jgi:hypothetical protein